MLNRPMYIQKYSLAVFVLGLGSFMPADAQSVALRFPINGENPYTAKIISVLDHSSPCFYQQCGPWTMVEAYTGEIGKNQCGPSGQPCGFYNPSFRANNDSDPGQFWVTGAYEGFLGDCTHRVIQPKSADCLERKKILNYRGHSGYDYDYSQHTQIVAAADGVLYLPASDPINSGGSDPWCTYHTFYIKHSNGLTTWYLHAEGLAWAVSRDCQNPPKTDQKIADVSKGQYIANVGNFCQAPMPRCPVGYHLHFEVRRGCSLVGIAVQGCKVLDPYGWEWIQGSDNIDINSQATSQDKPLWESLPNLDLTRPTITQASLSPISGGWTATITGQNFATPGAVVSVWDKQKQYLISRIVPSAPTNTQIFVQLVNLSVSDPGGLVLKVENPNGPRSVGVVPSLLIGGTSVPLLLSGQPADGGGTFASFGGFWSANDRGDVSFSAGVDTNGDGAPDSFSDFELSAGQIVKLRAPGFTNISSVATHVRINNRGDMAFGDISGAFGGLPAAIYVLPSGGSIPIRVVAWGQACLSPCPVPGSTLYQLEGPLAISDAGDVAFSASLLNPQTNTATCCYFFLYSLNDGSINQIAGDGSAVGPTATPIGGTFAPGSLISPIAALTSTGDVIFVAQVTGTMSQGGIFRFVRGQGLSKIVAQGDPVPPPVGGVFGFPLMGRTGGIFGGELVFHAPVIGGSSDQVIALVALTQNSSPSLVAYEGEATGTTAGGQFMNPFGTAHPNLPFGGFGQNTAPPYLRKDGAVIFQSLLAGAHSQTGGISNEGVFLWNTKSFQKIAVDGDLTSSGKSLQGISASAANNLGDVFYFVASLQ
jgi:Peptidase family M23